tara:strand:- start:1834 stop:2094 length:261 start_codon:yes stop_codon:yes gene_type:complete
MVELQNRKKKMEQSMTHYTVGADEPLSLADNFYYWFPTGRHNALEYLGNQLNLLNERIEKVKAEGIKSSGTAFVTFETRSQVRTKF